MGEPPKVLLKKSKSLWLLFGFGLVLVRGLDRPGDHASAGRDDERPFAPVMLVWNPVVLPTAWQLVGQDGTAG